MASIGNQQSNVETRKVLEVLDLSTPHHFIKPIKRINEGHDVSHFLRSRGYIDIGIFVMQLNVAMCPRRYDANGAKQVNTWDLGTAELVISEPVRQIQALLKQIDAIIEEAPPNTGPRRFGNISFRKWYDLFESRVPTLLKDHLSPDILNASSSAEGSAVDELTSYLLGGFGSAQRLDYGTGHELSFLAFLGCIWKLGGFDPAAQIASDGSLERSIVLGILEQYLQVIRRLILTYTLEPAGSHGVWGLDDHFFLSYIFGSAQYSPAISDSDSMPIEGSLPNTPNTGDVTNKASVDRERKHNMYFSAVGFINDVKTGPFWEHSPILFDISGIKSGWAKVNKGMIKMYNAEVLSKFPVVQHFPFGSLFSWDPDPNAAAPTKSVHTSNQPLSHTVSVTGDTGGAPTARPAPQEGTRAPWASQSTDPVITTAALWARPGSNMPPPPGGMPSTRAPWAAGNSSGTSPFGAKGPSDHTLPRR